MTSPATTPSNGRGYLIPKIGALVLCGAIAGYLWYSRIEADKTLQTATITQLSEIIKREPDNAKAYTLLGQRHQKEENFTEARTAFKKAAELDGDSETAWLGWAQVATAQGEIQEAYSILSVYLKTHPRSANALLALATFYHNQDAIQKAYDTAKKATEADPKNVRAWRRQATEAVELKRFPEAEAALLKAISLVPSDWRSHFMLGSAYLGMHRESDARTHFQRSAEIAPMEATPLREIGKLELTSAKDDATATKALQTLQRAFTIAPQDENTALSIGKAQLRLRNWQEARTALEQAIALQPNDPVPYFDIATAYARLGKKKKAQEARQRHIELEAYRTKRYNLQSLIYQISSDTARSNQLRLDLARLYASHNDFDLAIREYQHLQVRTPNDNTVSQELVAVKQRSEAMSMPPSSPSTPSLAVTDALVNEGDSLMQQQRFSDAKKAYVKALLQNPRSAAGYLGLGLALNAENNQEDAFRAFNKAIQLDSNLNAAQYELAKIYLNNGFADEAIKRTESILKADPDNALCHNLLGLAYQKVDVRPQAIEHFVKAVALDPQNVDYLVNLAYAEDKHGKFEDAEKHYREAVSRAPQNGTLLAFFGTFLTDRFNATHKAGLDKEAEDNLKRSLALLPDNFVASLGMGNLFLARNDPKQAIPYLQTTVRMRPEVITPWYRLSLAYDHAGDKVKAAEYRKIFRHKQDYGDRRSNLEMLARERNKDASLRLQLARIYAEGGDYSRAINQYQMCLSLDPKQTIAKKEMDTLIKTLKEKGQMPHMETFNGMVVATVGKSASPSPTPSAAP